MDQRLLRRRRARRKQKTGWSKLLQELMPYFKSIVNVRNLTFDQLFYVLVPLMAFMKDSMRVLKRCTKPDRHEFQRAAIATAVGFFIMGFLGFIIKLMHIPITNIIVG